MLMNNRGADTKESEATRKHAQKQSERHGTHTSHTTTGDGNLLTHPDLLMYIFFCPLFLSSFRSPTLLSFLPSARPSFRPSSFPFSFPVRHSVLLPSFLPFFVLQPFCPSFLPFFLPSILPSFLLSLTFLYLPLNPFTFL